MDFVRRHQLASRALIINNFYLLDALHYLCLVFGEDLAVDFETRHHLRHAFSLPFLFFIMHGVIFFSTHSHAKKLLLDII